jgi:O-antigen ligase
MKVTFFKQVFYAFPVLFCFMLPFGGLILSGIIIAWLILSIFNLKDSKLQLGIKNIQFKLLCLFFISTCVSAFFSYNSSEALTSIEIKFSFIIFPWLFFCFEYPISILKKCLIGFVSGCFFACIILLGRAAFYAFNGQSEYFFYTSFSAFLHPSYFAMYLTFAISIIVLFYDTWFNSKKEMKYTSYFFITIFIICIFLCSSKLGIIGFFIITPILFLHKNKKLMKPKYLVLIIIIFIVGFMISSQLFPESFARLQVLRTLNTTNVDKTSKESTAVRLLIWQQALKLIAQEPIVGHGVGDVNDKLYESYQTNGLTGAYQHKLNAHNQYLQTYIGLGLIGFILMLYFTIGQLIVSLIKAKTLMVIFSLLLTMNFLVESMLQTAAGVLFFAFFYCLIHLIRDEEFINA